MSLSRKRRRRLRDFPFMLCCAPHLGRRTRPLPVTLKRLFAARFVFILGMLAPFLKVEAGASVFPAAPVAVFWTGGAEQGPGAGFLADGAAFVKIGPGSRRPRWQFAPLCLGFRPGRRLRTRIPRPGRCDCQSWRQEPVAAPGRLPIGRHQPAGRFDSSRGTSGSSVV